MSFDPTENIRRDMVNTINSAPELPEGLSTEALQKLYEVTGFMAPFVMVRRRADGVNGTMLFRHDPRVYFDFTPS